MHRIPTTSAALAGLTLCVGLTSPTQAQTTVGLDLFADGESRVFEYFSDVFSQLDRPLPGSSIANDGYYSISAESAAFQSDPFANEPSAFVAQGSAIDMFNNDADFQGNYTLTYDNSTIVAGAGIANVTALSLPFTVDFGGENGDPTDGGTQGDALLPSSDYTTTASNISGTVTLLDGELVSIDLTADVGLQFENFPSPGDRLDGTFTLAGNRFALAVDDPAESLSFGNGGGRYVFDVTGEVTNVIPEPASAIFVGLTAALVSSRRRLFRDEFA
ncbi:MAG: hypothetical protein AAF710_09025 [Planctomycetota bacterium]